jgi:CO/xanthine dehydrogenase Mo-binding subunit
LDLSISFASEQTIDELAHALGMDPVAFRRRNMSDPRWIGVMEAVVKASAWTPHAAGPGGTGGRIATGRGIGIGTHTVSYGAAVADITVNRDSGEVRVKHLYGALDAGLVVNPALVENQIAGMLVQAASRALIEEVQFTPTNVTSLDWKSYPVLRFADSPDVTPIVVQRMNERSTGAGEEVMGAAVAAIANAFFDATGVRMRQYPMTPERVRAVLRA